MMPTAAIPAWAPMNPDYLAVFRGLCALHRLAVEGRDESPEADTIRDATDGPWRALSGREREQLMGLSEDLYAIGELSGSDIPRWALACIGPKEWYAAYSTDGDLPPTVIPERDDEPLAVVVAPGVDPALGLHAAVVCRSALDPDALVVAFDAHFSGLTPHELTERFGSGDMLQLCDGLGLCSTGLIADALVCCRVTRDGTAEAVLLPYEDHGPGTPFRWLAGATFAPAGAVAGPIASALAALMTGPLDPDADLRTLARAGYAVLPPDDGTPPP